MILVAKESFYLESITLLSHCQRLFVFDKDACQGRVVLFYLDKRQLSKIMTLARVK